MFLLLILKKLIFAGLPLTEHISGKYSIHYWDHPKKMFTCFHPILILPYILIWRELLQKLNPTKLLWNSPFTIVMTIINLVPEKTNESVECNRVLLWKLLHDTITRLAWIFYMKYILRLIQVHRKDNLHSKLQGWLT